MKNRIGKHVFTIELPYPPSVNTYWRHNRGRTHISTKGKQYRKHVVDLVTLKKSALNGRGPFTESLQVSIEAFPPDNRRRDLDNVLKAILDSLEHAGVYKDDSQITKLIAEKREKGGRVRVTVEEI